MSALSLLLLLCGAEILTMAPFSSVPALLPQLVNHWHLTSTQAGLLGGAYFLGYLLTISHLSGATDRMDAKGIYILGSVLAGIGSLVFVLMGDNWIMGCLSQLLCGAGLAGTYMPGLRALTDRMPPGYQTRFVAFYTSTFGIGASLSYAITGWIGHLFDFHTAFFINALFPLSAALLIGVKLKPISLTKRASHSLWRGQLQALKNNLIRQYIAGYAVHCWELFAFRSWVVVILTESLQGRYSATLLAAFINLAGIPASILGNEFASQHNRHRFIRNIMLTSGLLAWVCGLLIYHSWLLIVLLPIYFFTVMADSGALTAGLIESTPNHIRGTTMAVYSLAGFGAGFVGPIAVGVILDLSGGQHHSLSWILACGSMGVGSLIMSFIIKSKPTHSTS